MNKRGVGTCACERCGSYCHHQQSHCDSCQEVRRLREALDELAGYVLDGDCSYCGDLDVAREMRQVARAALEETPW